MAGITEREMGILREGAAHRDGVVRPSIYPGFEGVVTSGRPLFTILDFRVWAMNGAPSLAIAEQSAAQAEEDREALRELETHLWGDFSDEGYVEALDCEQTGGDVK